MSEFSPFWAETRDMALATTSAGPEMKKSRQKDPTLSCAGSLTSARSAGSFREFSLTLFSPRQDGNDAFS